MNDQDHSRLSRTNLSKDLSEADLVSFCAGIFPSSPTVQQFVNEARFGLSRVLPVLSSLDRDDPEILEVGAGSCILSAYLASKHLRVTALEPMASGFDSFTDLQERVLNFCQDKGIALDVVRRTGEQLDLPNRFSVAYTINAFEHMRDPLLTLDNMYRSLEPGGLLFAHCPNYTVPLDVHFSILLVTRSKPLNGWLHRSKIARNPSVWDGLHFLRYIDIRRHLQRRGFIFTFNTTILRDSIRRLQDDPIFARRMPLPVRAIGGFLRSTGLIRLLSLIPARFQTPMEVLIRKP